MKKIVVGMIMVVLVPSSLTSCWLGAGAAVGGEGVYLATQEKRTAGETFDDQMVLTSVKSKLVADPDVAGLSINVDVFKGKVTLRGYAKTQMEIDRAIKLAHETKGVTGVDSRLVLDIP